MIADFEDQDDDDSGPVDPLLVEWAAELALRMREGKTLDWQELARRHPDRTAALQDLLPAFDLVAGLGSASGAETTRANGAGEPLPGLGQLGEFRLLREVGRGGMGVVYEAVQRSLGRRVALKVLPPTATMDARQVQRFQVEARAAALLQHDRIVPVYAVGCEHGVPFYAMQYIEGRSLAQYIRALAGGGSGTTEALPSGEVPRGADRTDRARDGFAAVELPASEPDGHAEDTATAPLSSDSEVRRTGHIRMVARLGLQTAEALAYAHAQGVVHRDIKPGNLLLDGRGDVWITDFGLARVQTDPTLTATGTVLGTLRYMSPEQAIGDKAVVDHRTDVYSLGATLYELLTLRPAVPGRDACIILRRLAEEEPAPIRSLNPAVPPDLQTIVMKALARDVTARYATAAALAEDLRRFLAGEPILASPPSVAARLRRWAGRRKALAVSSAVGALALVVGFAVAAWYAAPERHLVAQLTTKHQDIARKNEELGRRNRYLARSAFATSLHKASLLLKAQQPGRCRDILNAVEADAEGFDPGEFAWRYVRSRARTLLDPIWMERVNQAYASPDGNTLVTIEFAGVDLKTAIHVVDRFTLRPRTTIMAPGVIAVPTSLMRFSPDGRLLYCTEQQPAPGQPQRLWAWELATGKLRAELRLNAGRHPAVVVPLAGERVLIFTYPNAEFVAFDLWELRPDRLGPRYVSKVVSSKGCFCFASADGRTLAVADVVGLAGRIRLFDVLSASFRERPEALLTKGRIDLAVFSKEGQVLVVEDNGNEVVFWDLSTGRTLGRHDLGREVPWNEFSASPDGRTATVFDRAAGSVTFWDRDRGRAETIGPGRLRGKLVREPLFSPDGSRFATLAENRNGTFVAVWDTRTRTVSAKLAEALHWVGQMSFTPDGRELCIDSSPLSQLWRINACAPTPTRLAGHSDEAWAVAFSPDGRVLASGSDDPDDPQTIKLWDVATGARIGGWFAGEGTVSKLAFSPDGRALASSHLAMKDNVRLWDAANGKPLGTLSGHALPARSVAFSPDGAVLASCDGSIGEPDRAGTIRLWDARTQTARHVLEHHTRAIFALAFSPDGKRLASGGDDGVRLWEPTTGQASAFSPEATTGSLSFSPAGDTLAFAVDSGSAHLQAISASSPRLILRGEADELKLLAFAPDGAAIAAAGESGVIRLFDVLTGEELLTLEGHASKVHGLSFSPDGSTLASCSHDGAVCLWRAVPAASGAGR